MNEGFWRSRRVLVTGHTGFKGAWLCLWLKRLGATVAGYALDPPTSPSLYQLAAVDQTVESTIADVRDLSRLSRAIVEFAPEILIHMAAQSVVLESYEDPVATYSTNVIGTVNVLEAVRRAGGKVTLVNVTTDKCYANRQWVWGYRENDQLGGNDPYSNSKACSELVTQSYRHSFFPLDRLEQHGVAVASARAGNVIGGGDWTPHQLIPDAIGAYQRGSAVLLRQPASIRPWQHVLDCLRGYLMLAQALAEDPKQFSGEWNFGPAPNDTFTVQQVAQALAAHWKVEPAWQSASGASHDEELELRLDSSKADRMLNWRCRLPIRTALDWVAEWYLRVQNKESARDVSGAQIDTYMRLADVPMTAR